MAIMLCRTYDRATSGWGPGSVTAQSMCNSFRRLRGVIFFGSLQLISDGFGGKRKTTKTSLQKQPSRP